METLRRVQRLTCQLMLVWFALWIGVAGATPVFKPHSAEVVCSGSGAMMVMPTDDGSAANSLDHEHDCHLCVMVGAPPVPQVFAAHQAPAETPFVQLPATVASASPAPFQPRGPPVL